MYGWYSEKQKSVIQRHFEEKKRKTPSRAIGEVMG